MFNGFHSMGAGGWVLMALFWVALVALIIWLVARLFPRGADDGRDVRERSDTPRDILDRRLATGELDVETYEELREQLDPRPPAGRR
jgi:putative membrane protein